MSRFWKLFLRVLRSYSIEEKVISIVLAVIVAVAFIQGVAELFRTPDFFLGDSVYSEGLVSERPVVLNPLYEDFSEANREVSSLIFSGLTRYDPDLKSFVSDLADLTVTEDRKTYRFVLKDHLLWHDGRPVTADDVFFTFHDIVQNPDFQNPVLKANFEGVEIKKIDEKTIEFLLSSPNSFFITNTSVGIVPKHILENVSVAELPFAGFNLTPVGTGPYKVTSAIEASHEGRQKVLLTAFEQYYGELPKIKHIRFNIYPDSVSLAKEKNAQNIISRVPRDIWEDVSSAGRFSFTNYELPQYTAIFFNMDSLVLEKNKVRLALQKSVDKEALLKLMVNKTAVDTPLMELNQSEWIFRLNLDEAKGALFDSGYKMDKNSDSPYRRDAKGETFKLGLLTRKYDEGSIQAEEAKTITDFFTEAWKAVGIQLDVQLEEADVFNQRLQARDYDMVLTGQSLGYNFDTYSYWHSSQATDMGLNLSNYRSFAADALIERIRDVFDAELKEKLTKDLAKEISQDIPGLFLFRPSYVFATDGKVKAVELKNLAYPSDRFAHIERWCVNC